MKRNDIVADESQKEVVFDRCKCRKCGKVNAVQVPTEAKTNIGKPAMKESNNPKWQCDGRDLVQVWKG